MDALDYTSYWITGTDTDVGKSVVSAMLVTALESSYWKPVQSGTLIGTDTEFVRQISGLTNDHFIPEVYKTTQPLSPHLSARIDNISIDLDSFHQPDAIVIKNRTLIIEGAGGVLVPLNSKAFVIDLMKRITAPVIIVCRSTLGTINHSLTTIEALKSRDIPIKGFIMNGPKNAENERAVSEFGQIPHLGSVPHLGKVDRQTLLKVWKDEGFETHFNT
jgi:dethiobiotin synthetase